MAEVKTIKNVDEETWTAFKAIAARNKMKAAEMLKLMIEEYEKKRSNAWNKILNQKTVLTEKERKDFTEAITTARKEYGWRI